MAEFTYQTPPEGPYLRAVLKTLEKEGWIDLCRILERATCSINATSTFSRERWNGMSTSVSFYIAMKDFESLELGQAESAALTEACDRVMPPMAGLDVQRVDFFPSLEEENKSLERDLQQTTASLSRAAVQFSLPDDILAKGKEMAEVYLYLYTVENYLRLFIETVATKAHGSGYFMNLALSNGVKGGIKARKEAEAKNQWVSVRGGSELFYLDFKDLGDVILNNWDLFKAYFRDQAWIKSKLDDLGSCRNLVAHNSFLGDHERDVIRVNFKSIVKQLNPHMK